MEIYTTFKEQLLSSLNDFIQTIAAYLPNLLSAVILLVVGCILAWIVKWIILRLGDGFDRIVHAIGIASLSRRLKWPLADILALFVYWLIILFFLTAAIESLGLPALAELLNDFINYLPTLLIAGIFVFGGTLMGNALRDRIVSGGRSRELQQAALLGSLTRISIITLAVIVGLAQIGLDVRLIEYILTILVAAIAGAIVLAFGLGAAPTVANIISARYVRKQYQVGQVISINNLQGAILELLTTGVILDTDKGRTFIPARLFNDKTSVLLDNKPADDD